RRFEHLPLAQLQGYSDLPGGVTLFDSIVIFENYPINNEVAAEHGLELSELHAIETTNYPLSVMVGPGRRLTVSLDYDPALFDVGTVERMAGHLRLLLDGFIADPDRAVAELPVLSGAEARRVLVEWNDTEVAVAAGTVPGVFAAQV